MKLNTYHMHNTYTHTHTHTHTHTCTHPAAIISSFGMGYSATTFNFLKKQLMVWFAVNLIMVSDTASGLHPVGNPLQRLSINCFLIGAPTLT
jgi:hypothetical protein